MLDKTAILALPDLPREEVHIPEWGGSVFVRTMTGIERDAFELACAAERKANKLGNVRAQLLVRAMCDADGKRLFDDADAKQLGNKSSAALDRLYEVAARLSGIGSEAEKEAEKN